MGANVISSSNSNYEGSSLSFSPIAINDPEVTVDGIKTVTTTVSDIPSVSGGSNVAGSAGYSSNLRVSAGYIQYRQESTATVTDWTNLILISTLSGADGNDGTDGVAIELQVDGNNLQWRYITGGVWTTIYDLSSLTGTAGLDGSDGSNGQALVVGDVGATVTDSDFTGLAGRSPVQTDSILNTNGGDKVLYIRTGVADTWTNLGSIVGNDGSAGTDADEVIIQYSVNGTTGWDTTYDGGEFYIRFSTDNGSTWSNAAKFIGDNGSSTYLYVAYATDGAGTGWSLTPTTLLTYRAEVQSSTYYNPINSTQFNALSPTWIKYLGDDGAAGSDGNDGDQWEHATGVPSDATVLTYDLYYINDATWNIYKKDEGAAVWNLVGNIQGADGDKYKDTSLTSLDLSTLSIGGSQAITVTAGYSWSIGQLISVVDSATNYFVGTVTSYASTTLTLSIVQVVDDGSGAVASWTVNLAGGVYQEDSGSPQVYTITLNAGTSIAARLSSGYTSPTGWVCANPSSNILRITHGLNKVCISAEIQYVSGISQIRVTGSNAFSSLTNNTTSYYIDLADFGTYSAHDPNVYKVYITLI